MQRQPCVQLFDSCTCYLLHAACYMLHACSPSGLAMASLKLLKIQQILRFQNASHYLRELIVCLLLLLLLLAHTTYAQWGANTFEIIKTFSADHVRCSSSRLLL